MILAVLGLYFYNAHFIYAQDNLLKSGQGPLSGTREDGQSNRPIRIGYFHGGRNRLFYRAYLNGYFKAEGLNVKLFTGAYDSNGKTLIELPDDPKRVKGLSSNFRAWGKMTGLEIINKMVEGDFEGGCVGATSFIYSIQKNLPIVAIAGLGHSRSDKPSRGLVIRSGVKIENPRDLKGKRIGFVRKGSGDELLLRNFIKDAGLKDGDVVLVDIEYDRELDSLARGQLEACLLHYGFAQVVLARGQTYLYKKLDWIDPSVEYALLVFRKDFIERHPAELKKLVDAYKRRIEFEERKMTKGERKEIKHLEFLEGHLDADQMERYASHIESESLGLGPPVVDNPPAVRVDLLKELQDLMFKNGFIERKVDIEKYIDRRFIN
jgi:ABC-type nitrate/sulfonate/bicarbonate transport system substrate-binding protein